MTNQTEPAQWWSEYSESLHPAYRSLLVAEQLAAEIQNFSFVAMPGLVQTEAYSQAVTVGSQLLPLSQEELKLFGQLRVERQWHVFEQPKPPRLQIIIDEPVLYRRVGNLQILCAQLLHLAHMARLPHITIRILPLSRPIDYSGDYGLYNFTLFKSREDESTSLYCEQASALTQSFTHDPGKLRLYQLLFKYLWEDSLSANSSLALIDSISTTLGGISDP